MTEWVHIIETIGYPIAVSVAIFWGIIQVVKWLGKRLKPIFDIIYLILNQIHTTVIPEHVILIKTLEASQQQIADDIHQNTKTSKKQSEYFEHINNNLELLKKGA